MLLGITVLAFFTMFVLVYLVCNVFTPSGANVAMRLKALERPTCERTDIEEELSKSFVQRIVSPVREILAKRIAKFAPEAVKKMIEQKITMAGGFNGINAEEFILLCGALGMLPPFLIGIAGLLIKVPLNKAIGLGVIGMAVALYLPFMLLQQKIVKRKRSIQKDLPDVLDLLTVSVEAGLGFDGALSKLAEKMKGALVEEFNRVLQEIRMGVSRRESLTLLGVRCAVPDLMLFAAALIQADQLGVSIGNVLRVQSVSMREKRRQRAEEQAMKAPIKMMLPLVVFIFPTIFIVLLGPAIIQVIETFSNR